MSDFYSRCLTCNIDLPRGLAFCSGECRARYGWNPVIPIIASDEVGNADVRETATAPDKGLLASSEGTKAPSAVVAPRCPVCKGRGVVLVESGPHTKTYADCGEVSCSSRKERLAQHDPKSCGHRHCQPTPY